MIVCLCNAVSDRDIARAVEGGACTPAEIARCTRAGTSCGACREAIAGACAKARERQPQLIALRTLAAIVT